MPTKALYYNCNPASARLPTRAAYAGRLLDSFRPTQQNKEARPPSSSGLGCLVLSQKTPVRVRLGVIRGIEFIRLFGHLSYSLLLLLVLLTTPDATSSSKGPS